MDELEQLSQIIFTILGNDNQARSQGELLLKTLRERDFNTYVLTFCKLLSVSPNKTIRIFCVVHLRRILSNFVESKPSSQWCKLSNDNQKLVKDLAIEVVSREEDGPTRRVLCDLIGELYATITKFSDEIKGKLGEEGRQWNNLLNNISGFLTSGNTTLIEGALKILGTLFTNCGNEFAEHKDEMFNILKNGLEHQDIRVKAGAIEAICDFVTTIHSKHCKNFQELIPLTLRNLLLIISNNEDLGSDALNNVNEMICAEQRLFRACYTDLFAVLKEILTMKLTIDSIKATTLDTMVQACEMLPNLAKSNPDVIKVFFESSFTYMITNVEEVTQEWLSPPEGFVETTDDSNPHDSAIRYTMHLIDRVIYKLGDKVCLPIFSELLLKMVGTGNWQYKYAALMGLSQVGEYVNDPAEMDYIVNFVLKFFKDEHPKVRYAAVQCIGQFSEDSKPEFQIKYNDKVVPPLIEMLRDQIPRVVSNTLAAFTNFLNGAEKGSVTHHVQHILEPCLHYLEHGISIVKESTLSTIATLAEACQRDFIPYWEKTAQAVFNILKVTSQNKLYKQVRGQAIETLVLIGESVGKEEFKKGVHPIIECLVDLQKNYVEEVDPQKLYILAGWQRICVTLKEDFLPYLEHVLPSLFALVEHIIESQGKGAVERKSNETSDIANALGVSKEGGLFHKANTNESQEVTLALKMINVFVLELKRGFAPYIQKTSALLTHLVHKSSNITVKEGAAQGLPGLVKIIQESSEPNKEELVRTMSINYVNLLWGVVDEEVDPEVKLVFIMTMVELFKAAGTFMNSEEVAFLSSRILKALKESNETKLENDQLLEDEDNDVDENEMEAIGLENANEDEYQCALAELIGVLFQTHKEYTLDLARLVYTELIPKAFAEDQSVKVYKFGLFLVDNLIEHIGFDLLRNEWEALGQALVRYITHESPELRHPAAYGLGLLAEKTKEGFEKVAGPVLKSLHDALQIGKNKGDDLSIYGLAKDNMIAAFGKVIKFQPHIQNLRELIQVWFKLLPLKYDKKEAKEQHDILLDLITADPSAVLGENGENLVHTLRVFALVADTKFSSPEFSRRMKQVIEALVSKPETKTLLQEALGKIEAHLREKLKSLLV